MLMKSQISLVPAPGSLGLSSRKHLRSKVTQYLHKFVKKGKSGIDTKTIENGHFRKINAFSHDVADI